MKIPKLTIDVAWSLLIARWKQTLVAAIGVTFSITMFVGLLSFMTGLNIMLDGLVINRTPHVRLYNEIRRSPRQPVSLAAEYRDAYHFISSVKTGQSREGLYNAAAIMRTLKSDPRVWGVSPKITAPLFFNSGSIPVNATLNGIDVPGENKLLHFREYISKGSDEDLATIPNSVVLGKSLADLLLVDLGDVVYANSATGAVFPLKLVGLYESGIADLDRITAYTSLATAQKMIGRPSNYFTDVQVKLHRMDEAPAVAREYKTLFDTQAKDIQTANAEFETGNFIRNLISYVVGLTLLIVAGFGIYNILNMMIYEKMDSIAILKATGFSGTDVRRIFLFIALSIGFFGGLLGLGFGYLVSLLIDTVPFRSEALPNVKTFPVNYDPAFYVIGILFSIVTTYFAGLFPAAKAAKADPVIIIRGK